ncbi:Transmembrane secretion effector [Pseudomonas syringae]|uniref:MFS transporter n=1 Tax=Pseudomonas syringae TaxID=317 RepID=UPI00089A30E8|nr:MFS transporter [Pseudomonas syringae]SDX04149.1 Transmembrane secretion effector [Pseudomonas syringae]SFM16658.1 Transmembrane secretion effector [Pseudomonas syringae]
MNEVLNTHERHNIFRFLVASSLWFICVGIQSVFLPWMLISVVHASAFQFGIAQMCLMLPVLILVIYGGYVADRKPLRKLLVFVYLAGALTALVFAVWSYQSAMTYTKVLMYALSFGVLSAFCAPAREVYLNVLGKKQLQKIVTVNIGIEFGIQVVGFAIGGMARQLGISLMFLLLSLLFVMASLAASRISVTTPSKSHSGLFAETSAALRFSIQHPVIFPVLLLNGLIGVFFLGSFFVMIPLHVSGLPGYDASLLATFNIVFMVGLIASVVTLVVKGGIHNKPRALISSCLLASVLLAVIPSVLTEWLLFLLVFSWGFLGGIALSMGQTLIQENAPSGNKAQVLALLMLFFMGGSPIGSFLMGVLLEFVEPSVVGFISAVAMIVSITAVSYIYTLWNTQHGRIDTAL